ncbi:MAG: F-type H+-transporting ATPase subunit b [Chloroflexota bacterium]|jgi:F-type H+-transporting ATPase subunit b|nr:F-type H+-transporting ATPase subunit b [Chloroflexota bacterium]
MTINVFWILISASTFIVFAGIAWYFGFRGLAGNLEARRSRIEQGLKDADEARREREAAAQERQKTLTEARREAADILARAQRLSEEERERGLAETRAEIERLREQAVADIDAERQRAVAEVRAQVADLALLAAGKVIGETLNDARQRRLVEEFLAELTPAAPSGDRRN